MSKNLVSVIVPVFNLDAYLETCFNSLIAQTYSNIEVIIVDDGSSDNSLGIIDSYLLKDSRFHLIKCDHKGTASARKQGIINANGDFITFVDGDDFCEIDAIDIMISEFLNSDCDIVVAQHRRVFPLKKDYFEYKDDYPFDTIDPQGFIEIINERRDFTLWAKMFKKGLFDGIIFHEGVPVGQDGLVLKQVILKSSIIKAVNKIVYNYIYRLGSAMRKSTLIINQLYFLNGGLNNLPFYKEPQYSKERDELMLYLLNLGAYYVKMNTEEKRFYKKIWIDQIYAHDLHQGFVKNNPEWRNINLIKKFPFFYSLFRIVPIYTQLFYKKIFV